MASPVTVVMSIVSAAAVGVVGVGAAVVATQPDEPVAAAPVSVVKRVIDGDTVDIMTDGTVMRVRLLNVDTPETKDPNKPVQCLGPKATEFLKELLPAGSSVTLKYDVDRTDRYGRSLAAVFAQDGTLVNTAVARAGLGIPMYVAPNDRYLGAVKAAQQEAIAHHRGLFSPDVDCTVPGQLDQVQQQVEAVPEVTSASTVSELKAAHKQSSQALIAAVAFRDGLKKPHSSLVWRAVSGSLRDELATRAQSLVKMARSNDQHVAKRIRAEKAKAAKRRAAARAAKERQKRAEAERQKRAAAAQAKSEAEARTRAAAERQAQERRESAAQPAAPAPRYTPRPKTTSAPQPRTTERQAARPKSPSGRYTGCRAYGPHGTSIDDQGRRYTKIPCP